MPVYTVHGPMSETARPSPDRIAFVRDGFAFWALLAGPFWLIWHRLWLALLGYLVVTIGAGFVMAALGLSSDIRIAVNLMIALLMGLEAASLRRWTLSRRKWRSSTSWSPTTATAQSGASLTAGPVRLSTPRRTIPARRRRRAYP